MNFCTYCNKEIKEIKKHIEVFHKPKPEKNNKGNFYCPICKIKIANKSKHYYSKLRRWNIEKDAVDNQYFAEDYIKHFEIILDKSVKDNKKDKEYIFWKTAKEELSKKDYKRVKEYIHGEGKRRTGHTGNNGRKGRGRSFKS